MDVTSGSHDCTKSSLGSPSKIGQFVGRDETVVEAAVSRHWGDDEAVFEFEVSERCLVEEWLQVDLIMKELRLPYEEDSMLNREIKVKKGSNSSGKYLFFS